MPDKYNFNHLVDWGDITYACIEDGCNASGLPYLWPDEKRREHYEMHQSMKPQRQRKEIDLGFDPDDLPTMILGGSQ